MRLRLGSRDAHILWQHIAPIMLWGVQEDAEMSSTQQDAFQADLDRTVEEAWILASSKGHSLLGWSRYIPEGDEDVRLIAICRWCDATTQVRGFSGTGLVENGRSHSSDRWLFATAYPCP